MTEGGVEALEDLDQALYYELNWFRGWTDYAASF